MVEDRMDAIVLAGGYATRLYPLTRNFPKPLLPINEIPLLDYIIQKLNELPAIDRIIISTNSKFKDHFSKWLSGQKQFKQIILHVEGSKSENEKLGAVAALGEIYEAYGDAEDFVIIAGDNLFKDSLDGFVTFFYKMKEHTKDVSSCIDADKNIVAVALAKQQSHHIKNSLASVILDPQSSRIITFLEKSSSNEQSGLIGTAIYALSNNCLKEIKGSYISQKGNNLDSPGYFIEWLSNRDDVVIYGYVLGQEWWDIGTMDSYINATNFFNKI
jgi:glucose-1-phosphate thymidylyltransferase